MSETCKSPSCKCNLNRREFLAWSGAAVGGLVAAGHLPAVAGPFSMADFEKLIPSDKKLHPDWVRSLTDRGSRAVYRGMELEKIGMPIGGITCGQVYLGGDGKLWHWDIFNRYIGTGAEHYARPMNPTFPFEQGFAIRIRTSDQRITRTLDDKGFKDISFIGEYPIGSITYRDPDSPVEVELEAFSPFIPLNVDDSSLPATVMRFTVTNPSADNVEVDLAGWMENAVCLYSGQSRSGQHINRILRATNCILLEAGAAELPQDQKSDKRPDIVFEDFEKETYTGWTVTGIAFGSGPIDKNKIPSYQGDVGAIGQRTVNSHATAPGGDVGTKDSHIGTLTSRVFTVERNFINFLIGGGAHAGRTCMNLLVEDKPVLSATGANDNRMNPQSWDVRRWAGKQARLQIVDAETGGWGNIGVDSIIFSDSSQPPTGPLSEESDFGTMTLALLDGPADSAMTELDASSLPDSLFSATSNASQQAVRPFGERLLGGLSRTLVLDSGKSATVTFAISWQFPRLVLDKARKLTGRFYAGRFDSARAVAEYIADHFKSLYRQTRLWHDTWYDSTLPYWFLDRMFLNTSILATSTCYRFSDGRFYGWEGVGCCPGTCGHVWQYAHAVARLFPSLERDTRQRVDFGLALQPNGAIHFRGEFNADPAVDAQAGTILRALREHQMSADDSWLKQHWPKIRRAVEWLIAKDSDDDGLIVSNQHNTLDTDWYGPVAWLSGMYLAALRAAEEMALEVDDKSFADRCRQIVEVGRPKLVNTLFNGEYFINIPDPKHLDAINSGSGCHIDQVFGQSWAYQVGLDRILPEKETRSALQSLWRYNFTPDVGPWRQANKPGRWYAMAGEGGLIMCTFPRADWSYENAKGKGADWAAGYFNECMNGFEYQAAGHMIAEGMLTEGLAVARMVHDRYHPRRRNPFNEIECGDHYARSMASYGVFLIACGYEYHGPRGRLAFAPRISPDDFRAAFTTAEGWGTFSQKRAADSLSARIDLKFGRLELKTLALESKDRFAPARLSVRIGDKSIDAKLSTADSRVTMTFDPPLVLQTGQELEIGMT